MKKSLCVLVLGLLPLSACSSPTLPDPALPASARATGAVVESQGGAQLVRPGCEDISGIKLTSSGPNGFGYVILVVAPLDFAGHSFDGSSCPGLSAPVWSGISAPPGWVAGIAQTRIPHTVSAGACVSADNGLFCQSGTFAVPAFFRVP